VKIIIDRQRQFHFATNPCNHTDLLFISAITILAEIQLKNAKLNDHSFHPFANTA